MTAILTVQNVEKSFGTRRVLDGVSFAVHARDRIALVGLNGAGKSTLLRLMVAGSNDPNDLPDAGLVTRMRGLSVEYVPQEPRLDADATVGELLRSGQRAHRATLDRLAALEAQIASLGGKALEAALGEQAELHHRLEGLGGWDLDHELRGLSAALDLPPNEARLGPLSGGEKRRVALARALLSRPQLLALDEPTNHLDAQTVAWLETRLDELPGALLLVTHDRYFLDRVANRILEVDRGKVYAYEGGYRRFLVDQATRLADEEKREQARASFVRRELDWIRRGPPARTTKQQARIHRFDAAVAAQPAAEDKRPSRLELELPMVGRLGKSVLELKQVTRTVPGPGGRTLFQGLSLVMKAGDRIGIIGPNGAGKTTLVRTILGLDAPDAGEVVVGQNTRFAYLDQARAQLRDDKTVVEEVAEGNDHVFLQAGPVHVRTFLRMMLFDDRFADTPIGVLSGGERNRVQLARLLRRGGNLLVLDEPTNDLDLITLGVLEEALRVFPGCALIVSHDRWFLDKVATGILAFEGDGNVTFYEGDFTSYLERANKPAPPSAAAPAPAPKLPDARPRPDAGRPRRLSFKEKQELSAIEPAILAAEEKVTALESELADPAIYKTRAAEVPKLVAALDEARREVERLYARWQELESLAE